MRNIFDSHAHYDSAAFDSDRDSLLAALRESGVCGVLNAGCDAETSYKSIALTRKYDFFWAAAGVHPEFAGEVAGDWLGAVEVLLADEKAVALGEIGLDYHYDTPSREVQLEVFEAQLELAAKDGYPVVIHSRDAAEDTLALLRKHRPKGVLHCFSGSAETAREVVSLGLYIGLTGVVTFANAKKARAVAAMLPHDRLLLETDCPYMAPVPHRGERSTSDMLRYTAGAVAELWGVSPQEVLDQTRENVRALYGI